MAGKAAGSYTKANPRHWLTTSLSASSSLLFVSLLCLWQVQVMAYSMVFPHYCASYFKGQKSELTASQKAMSNASGSSGKGSPTSLNLALKLPGQLVNYPRSLLAMFATLLFRRNDDSLTSESPHQIMNGVQVWVLEGFNFLSWLYHFPCAWGWEWLQIALLFPHLWNGDHIPTTQDSPWRLKYNLLYRAYHSTWHAHIYKHLLSLFSEPGIAPDTGDTKTLKTQSSKTAAQECILPYLPPPRVCVVSIIKHKTTFKWTNLFSPCNKSYELDKAMPSLERGKLYIHNY